MRRTIIAALAASFVFVSISEASVPRAAELDKCGRLHYAVKKKHGTRAPGRNICSRGVRFKWVSKDGERRHWATRPALPREVSQIIGQLRALLRPHVRAVLPTQPPAGVLSVGLPYTPAEAFAQCESGGDWDVVNASDHRGRYQLSGKHFAKGGLCAHLNPWRVRANQVACANIVFRVQGSGAWAQCGG